jgi:hypothetical protein
MSGGSGLPTPDMAMRKEYVTKNFLATVLEEEEERKAKACALQDLFFVP